MHYYSYRSLAPSIECHRKSAVWITPTKVVDMATCLDGSKKLISDNWSSNTATVLTILKISATIDSVDVEIIDLTEMAATGLVHKRYYVWVYFRSSHGTAHHDTSSTLEVIWPNLPDIPLLCAIHLWRAASWCWIIGLAPCTRAASLSLIVGTSTVPVVDLRSSGSSALCRARFPMMDRELCRATGCRMQWRRLALLSWRSCWQVLTFASLAGKGSLSKV